MELSKEDQKLWEGQEKLFKEIDKIFDKYFTTVDNRSKEEWEDSMKSQHLPRGTIISITEFNYNEGLAKFFNPGHERYMKVKKVS
jgi:hypothetical protein